MLENLTTGLIYRNPRPHVRSIHGYFPSVVALPGGEMLAAFTLAEAFEATNQRTHIARSADGGRTWSAPSLLYPGTRERLTSDASRIALMPNGDVVAVMARYDRTDHPEEGLANPETLGLVPTELLLLRSNDGGKSWGAPQLIVPPLEGPSFELCSPIVALRDGRWLLPTSTWRGWEGVCPNGMRAVALESRDGGRSWPEFADVMRDPAGRIVYWESRIVELPGGELLAVAWAYDEAAAADLPNQYTLSRDGGTTWSPPRSIGLLGQTMAAQALADGRLLCVYRRMDAPGLWTNLAHLDGDEWVNDCCAPLWGQQLSGLTATSRSMSHNFSVLRFGAPCITTLDHGWTHVAFWCYEDCVSNIRWLRFRVGRGAQASFDLAQGEQGHPEPSREMAGTEEHKR